MKENLTTSIKIDGVDFDVPNDVAKYIHSLKEDQKENSEKIVKYEAKIKDDEATITALKDEKEKLTKEKEDNKLSDEDIQKKVKERIELQSIADHLELKYDENTCNKDLRLSIIKKRNDKADMKDKDEAFINAYFTAIVDSIKEEMENKNTNRNKEKVYGDYVNQTSQPSITEKNKQSMYDDYKKKVIEESKNYKGAVSVS